MYLKLQSISVADDWVKKPFDLDSRFAGHWWVGSAKGPLIFISFADISGNEVARAQINPASRTGAAYPAWNRPWSGVTEIDLLEVRPDLRGRGIGGSAVASLIQELRHPVIALPLDPGAEDFWRTTAFTEYVHPERGLYPSRGPAPVSLFVCSD